MGYQKDVHYFTAMGNNKSAKCERQRNTYFSVISCVFYLDTSNNLLTHTEPRQQQLTLRARKAGSNSFKLVSLQQWGDISLFFFSTPSIRTWSHAPYPFVPYTQQHHKALYFPYPNMTQTFIPSTFPHQLKE